MYHIFIVGCGYTGRAIGRYFRAQNQRVYGLIRNADRKPVIEREGIIPVIADLTAPKSLEDLPSAHFIVWAAAPDQRNDEAYRKLYIEGLKNFLLSQKKRSKPFLMVHLSSTGVYGDRGGEWVQEEEEPKPDNEKGNILLEAENIFRDSSYPNLVMRLGGIYGPRRNRVEAVLRNKIKFSEADRYMNMIHVEDIPPAVHTLFKDGQERAVYNGTDDEPVKATDFYRWLCNRLNLTFPLKESNAAEGMTGKKVSNRKLKSLGFQCRFPNFREGYEVLIKERLYRKEILKQ